MAMARALSPLETARRCCHPLAPSPSSKYKRGDDETAGTVCRVGIYPQLKNFHAAARRVWRRLHAIDFESSDLISVNDSRLGVLTALHRLTVCMNWLGARPSGLLRDLHAVRQVLHARISRWQWDLTRSVPGQEAGKLLAGRILWHLHRRAAGLGGVQVSAGLLVIILT